MITHMDLTDLKNPTFSQKQPTEARYESAAVWRSSHNSVDDIII